MASADVTELLRRGGRGVNPILFEEGGHTYTIAITSLRRSGASADSLVVHGIIFRDGVEWAPRRNFWPVIFTASANRDLDIMGTVIAGLVV